MPINAEFERIDLTEDGFYMDECIQQARHEGSTSDFALTVAELIIDREQTANPTAAAGEYVDGLCVPRSTMFSEVGEIRDELTSAIVDAVKKYL